MNTSNIYLNTFKDTNVIYILYNLYVCVSHSVMSDFATPWTVAHQFLCPWDFPGKNTEVGCHFLLQGIFLT